MFFGARGLYFFAYFHRMWYTKTKGSTDLVTGTCIIGKISVIFYKKPRKYLRVFPVFFVSSYENFSRCSTHRNKSVLPKTIRQG